MTMRMSCLDVMTAWEKVFSSVPPVSKDLCNYYMSYLYHYINEKLFEKPFAEEKRN